MKRIDAYGLRGLVFGDAALTAAQQKDRFEKTQRAMEAWRQETGVAGGSLGDFYDWLKEDPVSLKAGQAEPAPLRRS